MNVRRTRIGLWLAAFWYNPRAMSGPGCTPVSAILAGGGMSMAA